MEGKAVFGGGQGKAGEADNKLNIDSIIARLLEGEIIMCHQLDHHQFKIKIPDYQLVLAHI